VFTNRETGADLTPSRFTQVPQPVRAVNRPARLLYEQTGLAREARRYRIEVMFNPGFTASAFPGCPNVTVFHDLQHKRHPKHFRAFDLAAWNFFLYLSVRRSRMFVAISDATKKDLKHFYGIPGDRIVVTPLGIETAFTAIGAESRTPEPFFLCVSTLHPHKNLENLLRAFAAFRAHNPEWRLVMTGLRGFHAQAVEACIVELGLQQAVELTGWVDREVLYDLFRRATAMVYPSTFEGFGIPVVEAMAAGLPLACSNIEPIHSIVDGAALEFAPEDVPAMTAAMHRLVEDGELRRTLTEKGRTRAACFTWEQTARLTLTAIEASLRVGSSRRS
jgi:glycosyltransferase involved in cell wall biosynthesis